MENKPVTAYLGIVTGKTIIGANFIKDLLTGIKDIIGRRSSINRI
ncbi:YbjQ family protein [Tenacibaculum ovolyticum]|nr:YbjQ family protein [Tenacibaculum ovolyticum]